ncbi:hypothetical protein [Streptomyces europaeiscabiei]|uniref:hypothetical protein n=1 Tax=Streptomyces europaeiscabiei TaxID=146819 RepID=UPI002E2DDF65|nr:hypothetical protein [Streptomyces europaeiscabiei]
MESARSGIKSVKRLSRTFGAVAALTVGASLLGAPQASADDTPSSRELLEACDWADLCEFHPQSYWTYTGPEHQVGATAFNCASQTNQHRIDWADTTGSTNSLGMSIGVSAKFWGAFEASVEATYRHDWTNSHTDTESNQVNIPAGFKGWLERGTAKQQATGWYEIHFSERFYGHYVWYVPDYKSDGFNGDGIGYVNFKDAPMTEGERAAHC